MINGSNVLAVPSAVTIAFSAVQDVRIENLHFVDLPQDGIFIRNGGVRTKIKNNLIDGFCTRWYNGGGINIEMHTSAGSAGNYPTPPGDAVVLEENTIIARGPNFCKEDGTTPCSSDTQCKTTCGANAAVGILATWIGGENPPRVRIVNNQLEVTDKHVGIGCHGCRDSIIQGNTIIPYESQTGWSGLFTGIISEYPWPNGGPSWNLTIIENSIEGNGGAGDGRGILASSNSPESKNLLIAQNKITHKNIVSPLAALEVRGYSLFKVTENTLSQISGAPGMVFGNCGSGWKETSQGEIKDNVILLHENNPSSQILLKKVANLTFENNSPIIEPKIIC